ncbi:radical SAM mobile pair protein B [Methanomassiliicoccales archaeon LGM-RCC1]|nr:radical SAM mobile pair protein B [Methanomassiliicoccales archaeon LGM-RCC1]
MSDIVVKEIETKNIMTKSSGPLGGYAVNPYTGCTHGCRYCYASFMKRFTGHTEPWGKFLDVKDWPKVDPSKYDNQTVLIGTVTDPYVPQEKKYLRTRKLLEQLSGSKADITICTRSDLVLRDLDLLKSFERMTVSFSINTLDDSFRSDMDKAMSIERRLDAMKKLYDERIRTVTFISPVFPGITDIEAIIRRIKDQCDLVWLENLNLRGGFKSDILSYIEERYPNLVPLYKEIYTKKDRSYFIDQERKAESLAKELGCPFTDNWTPYGRAEPGHPVIVDYFYHEEVRKTNNSGVRNRK